MNGNLEARQQAFEALQQAISKKPFSVPFEADSEEIPAALSAAIKDGSIGSETLKTAFDEDQARLATLVGNVTRDRSVIFQTYHDQQRAAELVARELGKNLHMMGHPDGMTPQDFWRNPERGIKLLKEEREPKIKMHKSGVPARDHREIRDLNKFFDLTFRVSGEHYIASMKWPENGDVQRFEGAVQALMGRLHETAGHDLSGHQFFKGKIAPGKKVVFDLPKDVADSILSIASEYGEDGVVPMIEPECFPDMKGKAIERTLHVKRASAHEADSFYTDIANHLECVRTFGGSKWTHKIHKSDTPRETSF